jgi:hypothetical protein
VDADVTAIDRVVGVGSGNGQGDARNSDAGRRLRCSWVEGIPGPAAWEGPGAPAAEACAGPQRRTPRHPLYSLERFPRDRIASDRGVFPLIGRKWFYSKSLE